MAGDTPEPPLNLTGPDPADTKSAELAPAAGLSETAAGPSSEGRGREFVPTAKHWWLAFAVPVAVSIVSLGVAGFATLGQDNDVPSQTNTIVLPDVNGLAGQPNTLEKAGSCEVSRENFAGWGPDRPVVIGPIALPYPALNSDVDQPNVGDERNFFRIKDAANREAGGWSNEITDVAVGKQYLLQVYVHNSGANGEYSVARDVRAFVTLPSCRSRQISVHGLVRSSNAFPSLIWGGVNLSGPSDFALRYVPDSAAVYSNAHPNGLPVPGTDFLESHGAAVGSTGLDGVVPGGFGSSFYFTITVEVVDHL